MKSEHRHELKTNELAEWIENFPQWVKENAKTIIYISVVVVAVLVVISVSWYRKNAESVQKQTEFTKIINQLPQSKIQLLQAQAQGRDLSFMLIQPANNLQIIAQNTKNDHMAAFALIKRAESLRMELHYRLGTVDEQDLINQINLAKVSYAEAIKKSSTNPSLMATAKYGLGLCEEELGNFDLAEQIYRDIAANPDFEGTVAAVQAKQRFDTMADYQRKVVFKASPKTKPAESIQPQIQLNPVRSETPASGLPTAETSNEVNSADINLPSQ